MKANADGELIQYVGDRALIPIDELLGYIIVAKADSASGASFG
jgi:hypothetical protein